MDGAEPGSPTEPLILNQETISKFTEVMISLFLQYGGKSSDLMFTFKSYINSTSVESNNFNAEHL